MHATAFKILDNQIIIMQASLVKTMAHGKYV